MDQLAAWLQGIAHTLLGIYFRDSLWSQPKKLLDCQIIEIISPFNYFVSMLSLPHFICFLSFEKLGLRRPPLPGTTLNVMKPSVLWFILNQLLYHPRLDWVDIVVSPIRFFNLPNKYLFFFFILLKVQRNFFKFLSTIIVFLIPLKLC